MSYARVGADSDVYIIGAFLGPDNTEVLECMCCLLMSDNKSRSFYAERGPMLQHLCEHVGAGHMVPERVFRRIEVEMEEEE